MKITSARFTSLKNTIRSQLINAVRLELPEQHKYLARLNKVCRIQRERNIANGMPGQPWKDTTIEEVRAHMEVA